MSSIKLKHSGGNGVIIAAPSSNPASDRTITVPSNADGTILTTTNPKSGTIIQTITTSANTAFSSTSSSYVETVVTGSITPENSSSKIIITACVPVWPPSGSYMHVQLRSSGGNTNNDIGTWGDAYATSGSGGASYNSMYRWVHTSHSTTSEITYKIFARKQTSGTWYFPNNNTANSTISWMLTMEEQAA
jgi:hypothetical protein|tara:strand:+ start:468 stop:1037 length:570 start_codon:yes stop_codon:yes gene_type:complete